MKESIIVKLLDCVEMDEFLSEKSDEYIETSLYCEEYETELKAKLNDENKVLLEQYLNSLNRCWNLDQENYFRDGFIVGARIMIEILGEDVE